ncbi:MAG: hypothetical protein A2698_00665 [Candidatus Levybacteria bacterium RIFCSPHIGHO2_01_FULL_42_15]|nr:MAG: hypothetical protein A2698_00665 [Candidatus Levybacteria bacterium RIFCSPHIGHO2_01_FULL_42_15]
MRFAMVKLMRQIRGQSLIELLVTIALVSILLPALLTGFFSSRMNRAQQNQRLQAEGYLKEAQEALRSIREKDWTTLAVNGTYHPIVSGSSWALASGEEQLNNGALIRQIIISDVFRDVNGTIVSSGGTTDPSTKKIVISASWTSPIAYAVSSALYVTRYANKVYLETTQADFQAGTKSGVTVTNTSGGEVTLGAGGGGDWCSPSSSILEQLDLPKSGKATSVVAIFGEAFAGTGENSSGESFADIFIADTNPPDASIYGTIDGYKTNDIFGEADYGYIATDNNHKEVIILRTSSLPLIEYGYFNSPGNEFGESVFVANNVGYVVVKNKLYNFDLSSKSGSRPILDSNGVTLSKEGTSVYIIGSYAYVSIKGSNDVQLDIIDISNPSNMVKVGSADVNNQSAQDVFVNQTGTRAYIVTNATSPDEKEFHIVNIENKNSPVKIGSGYYTNGMSPEAVEVVPGNKAIVVGQGGEEYQVVNISNELSLVRCGGLQIDSGIFDSASFLEPDNDAYSYIVTGDASSEFKIIEGGPGEQLALTGTFESQTFDASSEAAFNRFAINVAKPSLTDITFQIAIAHAVSGSCSGVSYAFVGPDGTANTKFATGSAIPLSVDNIGFENPGRCMRYKAFLDTTDQDQSPVLYDINFNYSP